MRKHTLLEPIRHQVAQLGYELVDLEQRGTAGRPVLRLRVDRADSVPGHGITIAECGTISRALEAWLEREQSIGPRYVLEVSSPGIERPVRWPEHWRRFRGRQVRLKAGGLTGRPTATIVDLPDDEHVVLRLADGTEVTVAFADIREATLVVDWDSITKR
ncbi:MAG: ribosome maturation factor RimP [Gemmatimonadales bacterium]|jgi:ribosome maturation factor RimP|nr:MAG: ribosome maturation factor RimP [Gemmatimonadales bacterium]